MAMKRFAEISTSARPSGPASTDIGLRGVADFADGRWLYLIAADPRGA
jgi:hypothetical protein